MEYSLYIAEEVDKKFIKLAKKDKKQLEMINKKIIQIQNNPFHYKPLRGDMHGSRRVHVGSFVLVYEVDEKSKIIKILDYDHHDYIY